MSNIIHIKTNNTVGKNPIMLLNLDEALWRNNVAKIFIFEI